MAKRKRSTGVSRARGAKKARRAGKKRMNTALKSKYHSFSRYVATDKTDTISVSTSSSNGFSKDFSLDNVAGVAEFTSLFDQYRITKVECFFHLQSNPNSDLFINSNTLANQSNFYPKLWVVYDDDDANSVTLSQIKERANVKCWIMEPNKMKKFVIKPKVLIQTYGTALTTGYEPKASCWCDMANFGVKHYGLKAVLDCETVVPSTAFYVRVDYRYHFECKTPL
jgi:hypothetical protein